MTPFVLAAAGLLVALVMVIISKTFRYIMLSAFVALVVCLVAFPQARLCAGQAATSIVSRFGSTSNQGAVEVSYPGESAWAGEVDADEGDADEEEETAEVADDYSGSASDSEARSNLIAGAYGAGAGSALFNLLAAQDCDPIQKLASVIKLAFSAGISAQASGEDAAGSEPDMN